MNPAFLTLIRDTRALLEEEIKERTFTSCMTPFHKPKELSPPIVVQPKKEAPLPVKELTAVEANPMKSRMQKQLSKQFQEEIPAFFYFVTLSENAFPFLKRLAEATHNAIVPAKASLLSEPKQLTTLMKHQNCKLLIGFFEEMQNLFPLDKMEKKHTVIIRENPPLFLLENPATYAKDNILKQALWNALKALPLSNLLK